MIGVLQSVSPEQIAAMQSDPELAGALISGEIEEELPGVDLDKAWQGLHFLLTGDPYGGDGPLADAIMGGAPIGGDIGYGPARLLTPEQVAAVSAALQAVTAEELASRYDPAAFSEHEIYPFWDAQPEDLEYILANFEPLQLFYTGAAAAGRGVLLAVV